MSTRRIIKDQILSAEKASRDRPVRLLNMFVLFLSETSTVNPFYKSTRRYSEAWISKSDPNSMCLLAPHASAKSLQPQYGWITAMMSL